MSDTAKEALVAKPDTSKNRSLFSRLSKRLEIRMIALAIVIAIGLSFMSPYFLTKSKLYQAAQEAVERGLKFAYVGRRQKKRQFRSLWIVRINAAAKQNGASYSQLIHGLKLAGIELDRKILADLATNDAAAFSALVKTAKDAAAKPAAV